MMTYRTVLAVAVAGLAASSALAQTGIRNSAHNFSAYSWSDNQICKPCHIPHGSPYVGQGALWNHTLSSATYTLFDGTSGGQADLDRVSQLCMSCHDGTVALDSFGGLTNGTTFIGAVPSGGPGSNTYPYDGAANLGQDLRNDHPVGKTGLYPTSSSFNAATVTGAGTSSERHKVYTPVGIGTGTGSSTAPGTGVSLYQMTIGTNTNAWVVGCKTCHDPHNNGVNFVSGDHTHMLRFSNAGSALCLTCHIK